MKNSLVGHGNQSTQICLTQKPLTGLIFMVKTVAGFIIKLLKNQITYQKNHYEKRFRFINYDGLYRYWGHNY